MNAIGRGLASLIPRRNKDNAEDMLEQIDSMEELTPQTDDATETTIEADDESILDTPAEEVASAPKKQLNVIEEFEDLNEIENAPMPAKPRVTPLSIDPETGFVRGPVMAEKAPENKVVVKKTKAPAVKAKVIEETDEDAVDAEVSEVKPDAAEPIAAIPTDEEIDTAMWDKHEDRVEHIAIGDIEVNSLQPRRNFDPEEMQELTDSIEEHGILQPLVVLRKSGDAGYELVAGERRLRAAKKLGWEKVPCVVRTDARTDRGRLEMALIENIQRQNLNSVEEAMGYQRLHEEFGLTHEEIGERVGKSRVAITNVLRVLQLPVEIQRGLAEGKISPGHAKAILMIPDDEKQIKFYHHLLDEGLTVRKAETRARNIQRSMKLNDPLRKKFRGRTQLSLRFDGPLEEKYGYNARIKYIEDKNRFEVIFQAFSEKEAEELVGRLLGTEATPAHDEDVMEEGTES